MLLTLCHPLAGKCNRSSLLSVVFTYLQSRAKRVDTLCLFEKKFHSRTSLFSFPLPPISMLSRPQNLLENLAYSTLKRGRGKSTGFNAILLKTRNISEIVANFGWVCYHFARDCSRLTLCLSILPIISRSVMLETPPCVTRIFLSTTVANGNQPNISSNSLRTLAECS